MGFFSDQGIKVLCLDIDGTLYPKWMLNARMVRSLFPSPRIAMAFNWGRKEYRRVQDSHPTVPASRDGLLDRQAKLVASRLHKNNDIQQIKQAIDSQFYQAWSRSFLSIKAYEGMVDTLRKAKQKGLKIAVFSDFPIAEKLKTLGIEDLVDIAHSAEDSGYLKPSPTAFCYILDRLGVEPDQILYMGDSYSKDCQGAKRAGMYSCLITKKHKKSLSDADLIVGSWKEFASLVL